MERFQCSAKRHQCRHCNKFGHFSSLCFRKQELYKKKPRSPKAYQMTCGRLSTYESSISGYSSDSWFSEEEPFCLQMKVQDKKAHTSVQSPKHLVINLEFKVKPHKRKTMFLHARVDTCADVNLMSVSIYKKLFKVEDCTQIAPSNLQLATYTNKKVKIIGSCNLYIIHPDTRCLEETWFYVAGNEGSILISCTTSLALSLIKPHEKLEHPPPEGNRNAIYSSADKIKKRCESWLNLHQLVRKHKLKTSKEAPIVCSRDEQLKPKRDKVIVQMNNLMILDVQKIKETRTVKLKKVLICGQRSPKKDRQSEKPAMKSSNKKSVGVSKNYKATMWENTDSKSQSTVEYVCSDKNCQEKENNAMWSVTKETVMWLPKPAIRRLVRDKHCQSTRCFKAKSPRRPMYAKNCQF